MRNPMTHEFQIHNIRACPRKNCGGAAIPRVFPLQTTAEVEPVSRRYRAGTRLAGAEDGRGADAPPATTSSFAGFPDTSRGGMIVRMIEEMHPQSEARAGSLLCQ